MKALERDPDRRFQDAAEFGYHLEFYLYNDRFGPTNNALRDYMAEIFPEAKPLISRNAPSFQRTMAPDGTVQPVVAKEDKTMPIPRR